MIGSAPAMGSAEPMRVSSTRPGYRHEQPAVATLGRSVAEPAGDVDDDVRPPTQAEHRDRAVAADGTMARLLAVVPARSRLRFEVPGGVVPLRTP